MDERSTREKSFGIGDYWRMFIARGIRRPIQYFFQVHLYDLVRGTDTHTWLPREHYTGLPENGSHATFYMCSMTGVIRNVFDFLRSWEPTGFRERVFIDVGSGKGKVVFAWKEFLAKHKTIQTVRGIEYYEPLYSIARKNQQKLRLEQDSLFQLVDAVEFDYSSFGSKFILYFYNPFDEVILTRIFSKIRNFDVVVIYTYLDHRGLMDSEGFVEIRRWEGWHPEMKTVVYHRSPDGRSGVQRPPLA